MPKQFDDNEFVKMVMDRVDDIFGAVENLAKTHLLVGVPEDHDNRNDPDQKNKIGNAALAYIHNYGSERANIPARPFMEPGIENSKEIIQAQFKKAVNAAFNGASERSDNALAACGMAVAENIKQIIVDGIAPPLKRDTVAQRRVGRKTKSIRTAELKYEQLYRLMMLEGVPVDVAEKALFDGRFTVVKKDTFLGQDFEQDDEKGHRLATPLINSDQLLNSITYVLKKDV